MGFMTKYGLKHRDDQRTKAAELSLRASIYPLALVTTLFFLWVSPDRAKVDGMLNTDAYAGLQLRPS